MKKSSNKLFFFGKFHGFVFSILFLFYFIFIYYLLFINFLFELLELGFEQVKCLLYKQVQTQIASFNYESSLSASIQNLFELKSSSSKLQTNLTLARLATLRAGVTTSELRIWIILDSQIYPFFSFNAKDQLIQPYKFKHLKWLNLNLNEQV